MNYVFCILMISIISSATAQSNNEKDWANFERYASENAAIGLPAKGENRIVFMGNSITEGWKMQDPGFFKAGHVNRGISGQTTAQMLVRFRADVIALKPKTVVILAGINDIAENTGPITLEQIMANIKAMAELAKANKIKVILCSVLPANRFTWRPQIHPAKKVIALNKLIKQYCIASKTAYVDYYSSMVDQQEGLQKQYGEDGVHPNKAGYAVMKKIVLPFLKR